jgi:UDP-glucose 4-epimerase
MRDAPAIIVRKFPQVEELYRQHGWVLPDSIERVYDPAKAERLLDFRCATDFSAILSALVDGTELPFQHDPSYVSPKEPRDVHC